MAAQLLMKFPLGCEQYIPSVPHFVSLCSATQLHHCVLTCGQIVVQEDCPSVKLPFSLSSSLSIRTFPFPISFNLCYGCLCNSNSGSSEGKEPVANRHGKYLWTHFCVPYPLLATIQTWRFRLHVREIKALRSLQ